MKDIFCSVSQVSRLMGLEKKASQQKMTVVSTREEQKLQPDATLREWKTGSKDRSTRSSVEAKVLLGKQPGVRQCKMEKQVGTINW